ncbi:MAG: AraC family transcriptional regulator ligand-binding domain-containing protein [Granulosicoccus sp.]
MPASYVRALLRTIEERGYDPLAFASNEGIDLESLTSNEPISAVAFGRLYQRAILLLQDESLGMVSGARLPGGSFRMMCFCVVHCSDLQSIVQRMAEFLEVCHGATLKPRLAPGDSAVHLGFSTLCRLPDLVLRDILDQDGPVRIRTTMYMWHNLLGWFADRALPLQRVDFHFPAPDNGELWASIFGCKVLFEQPESVLVFPTDMFEFANVQNEQTLQTFLKTAPYRLIAPAWRAHTVRDRVLAVLGDDFSRPLPDAFDVAKKLGMSVSTLRRQLGAEDSSFQALKDEGRRAAAIRFLASTDLALKDIAKLLSFDEASAFFRAFKRWTGTTPTEYRNSVREC